MRLFAPVDCAFDEAFLSERYRRALPRHSLYANTALRGRWARPRRTRRRGPRGRSGFARRPLSDKVFANLVDTAEAGTVLARLHDSQPDLFRADSPAKCHARVERHLRLASANGIHAAPARELFSALALLLADDFTQQAAMAELLRRTRQGADYNDEIRALPDEFWQAAER